MVDIDLLERQYFYCDIPVEYSLGENKPTITIRPIKVSESELFLSMARVLMIDKNSSTNVEYIKMSYLQYLVEVVFGQDDKYGAMLGGLLIMCLGMKSPRISYKNKKPYIVDNGVYISPKNFDDISRIILHQNIFDYDDDYIDSDLKKSMQEQDMLKQKDIDAPTLERKMAIITSHTGILKKDLIEMTYRSFVCLFQEVCGEVRFSAYAGVSAFGKNAMEDWIYRKKKNKFEGYLIDESQYNKSMGGDGTIRQTNSDSAIDYNTMFNNFNKN